MEDDTIYSAEGVNIIQHGGSIYVTSGEGFWTKLRPIASAARPFFDRAKDGIIRLGKQEGKKFLEQQAMPALNTEIGRAQEKLSKLVSGRGAYLELTPEQRRAVDATKKGPKKQLSDAQLQALARGREIRAAQLQAKKL